MVKDSTAVSEHYGTNYFDWQKTIGSFGAWVDSHKFQPLIGPDDTVIDFGCGGGFLLNALLCKKKIGIEPNSSAAPSINGFGITHFFNPNDARLALGEGFADVIISTNALEHTLNPLQELKDLRRLLKPAGIISFIVPCDSVHLAYKPDDINHHLFSWSPMNLGNIFSEAGYRIEYAKPYIHKWPRYSAQVAKLGWPIFNLCCKVWARIDNEWTQVEIKASNPEARK
jgi:SAM-dependent methyltransferase